MDIMKGEKDREEASVSERKDIRKKESKQC